MEKAKELSEAIKFVCALANSIGEIAEDGKMTLADATHLVPLLFKLPAAIEGMDQIPSEVSELSSADLAVLMQMVRDDLDLPQDKIEIAIEDAIDICLKLYGLAQKIK